MTEPSVVNRHQVKSAASRAALLDAARTVLDEYGYHNATVQLITAAAGRSHGTFYVHFQSKEDIYATLLEDMFAHRQRESKALWHRDDPGGNIERSIDAYVNSFTRDRVLWQLLDGWSASSDRFQAAHANIRRASVNNIRKGILTASDSAHLDGLSLDLVPEILAAMTEETCLTLLLRTDPIEPDVITQHLTTLWGRMLGYADNGYTRGSRGQATDRRSPVAAGGDADRPRR